MQETLEYIKQAFDLKSQNCYKQAIEMLYKALEKENDNIEILFQLGELYFLLKNLPRATHYLEKVISINPNHLESLEILKQIAMFSNDFSKAYEIAQKIYKNQENSKNLVGLIEIASRKKDLNFIKSLNISEISDDKVLYAISKAFYDNNLNSKDILEKILEINPQNENALVLLGKIYFDENEFEKSKNIFNKFPKTVENPEVLNYLGLFAFEELQFIEAIKYFSKASNIEKRNSKYLYNLANAYFYNGWFDEALKSYKNAICLEPENIGFRYSLAYLYFEQKDFDKAQNEIDFILEHNQDYSLAHVLNALLKYEKKDFLGAQIELETNLKSGNDDNFTLVSLVKVYTELNLFEKAENLMKKVLDRVPNSLNYKCKLAELFIAEKKYDECLNIVEEILKDNENYILAYSLGAKASFNKGDFEKAKEFAQNSIALDINFAQGYYYLALVRFVQKDYDEALECIKRAITYDVNNADYYAKASEIYKAKGDYKTAIEYVKEAESISETIEYRNLYKELASLNRKAKI